jgi:glutamate synthase (NADPH/NADH) small chain
MKILRQGMPEQNPTERATDFREVNRGYDLPAAHEEAERCLQCKDAKCIDGCPVDVDIPGFIEAVA